jgi:ankyrin repeat protein
MARHNSIFCGVLLLLITASSTAQDIEAVERQIRARSYDDALASLQALHANGGETGRSLYLLSSLYLQNHDEPSPTAGLEALMASADRGYEPAMIKLIRLFEEGVTLARNTELADYYRTRLRKLVVEHEAFVPISERICSTNNQRAGIADKEILGLDEIAKDRLIACAIESSDLATLARLDALDLLMPLSKRGGGLLLHDAFYANRPLVFEWLLEHGFNPNAQNEAGDTPLHLAVRANNDRFIEALTRRRANLNVMNRAGLTAADEVESPRWRRFFAEQGVLTKGSDGKEERPNTMRSTRSDARQRLFEGWPALNVLSWLGRESSVENMLPTADLGALDPEGFSVLSRAACAGHKRIFERLLEVAGERAIGDRGITMHCVVKHGWESLFDRVKDSNATRELSSDEFRRLLGDATKNLSKSAQFEWLLQHKPIAYDLYPEDLIAAFRTNDNDIAWLFWTEAKPVARKSALFRGVQLKLPVSQKMLMQAVMEQWSDSAGNTPLIKASAVSDAPKVQQMLTLGAEVNQANALGNTATHAAVQSDCLECLVNLLNYTADVEIRNGESFTPLMIASISASESIVKALIKAGANPRRRDLHGRSAIDLANEFGRENIAAVLELAE